MWRRVRCSWLSVGLLFGARACMLSVFFLWSGLSVGLSSAPRPGQAAPFRSGAKALSKMSSWRAQRATFDFSTRSWVKRCFRSIWNLEKCILRESEHRRRYHFFRSLWIWAWFLRILDSGFVPGGFFVQKKCLKNLCSPRTLWNEDLTI